MNGSQEGKGLWSLSNIRTKAGPLSVKPIVEAKTLRGDISFITVEFYSEFVVLACNFSPLPSDNKKPL